MRLEAVLNEAGITPEEHLALLNACFKQPYYGEKFDVAFKALKKAGATPKDHRPLYEACIRYAYFAERIPAVFKALKEAGATPKDHLELFEICIQNSYGTVRFDTAFKALKEAGLTLEDHLALYVAGVINARSADKFARAFKALKDAGFTVKDHLAFYKMCIQYAHGAEKLPIAFKALKDVGLTLKDHLVIYVASVQNVRNAEAFANALKALKEAGATLKDHLELYQDCIKNSGEAEEFAMAFKALKAAGATPKDHCLFYEACIQDASSAETLVTAFKALKEAGAIVKDHRDLYEACIRDSFYAEKFSAVFNALKKAGLTLKDHLELYVTCIQKSYYTKNFDVGFKILREAGFTPKDHLVLYAACFEKTSDAEKFDVTFQALKEAGASVKDHLALYGLCISYSSHAEKFARVFKVLKEAGATFEDHVALYAAGITKVYHADKFATALKAVKEAGLTLKDHWALYEACIQQSYSSEKLDLALKALKESGATPKDHLAMYMACINKSLYAEQIATAFNALKEAGAPLHDYFALYEACIQNASDADKLATVFTALKNAGATVKEHLKLYKDCIPQSYYAKIFATAFTALKEAGFPPDDHPELYEACIKQPSYATKLATASKALNKAGVTLIDYLALFVTLLQKPFDMDKLATAFRTLKEAGATPNKHLALFELVAKSVNYSLSCLEKMAVLHVEIPDNLDIIEPILNKSKLALGILTWLETNHLTKKTHDYIYKICFLGDTALLHSPYNFSKIKIKLEQYFKKNSLRSEKEEGYPAQRQEVQAIMSEVLNEDITEGPLNKSQETRDLETILQRIAIEPIENMDLRFDDSLGYILQFGEAPELYLSEILRLVNFNHIALSEQQVASLGAAIEALSSDFMCHKMIGEHRIVQELPEAARSALACYRGDRYKNINRFFRGVVLTEEALYAWLKPVHGKYNLMANFLAGSLINWAAAELPRILIATPERAILEKILSKSKSSDDVMSRMQQDMDFYQTVLRESLKAQVITEDEYGKMVVCFHQLTTLRPTYGLVDRGEKLGRRVCESRLVNPEFAPSVVSFSVFDEGYSYFRKNGAKITKLETSCSNRPIINPKEGEILVPQGTAFLFTKNPAGGFFAREVNSPGIVPDGGYWSAVAIAEAYRNHLSKCYKESASQLTMNNKKFYRPNHGLAHTYRVMLYIDVVIDYFAHHAEEEMFRLFCQGISPEEREWLRVAAAYSVTGRENEMAAADNLKQYDEFREASRNHMTAFLDRYPPKISNIQMQERMLDIVRWMGNPGYETERDGHPPINEHRDPYERAHRNVIHRILTIAHKLDLPRCYDPKQFTAAMIPCITLSKKSSEQQVDYLRMIRYAIDLNLAHGNALRTALSSDDLIYCSEPYRPPFGAVSTNLHQLRVVTKTVPRPRILEPYQFSVCGSSY